LGGLFGKLPPGLMLIFQKAVKADVTGRVACRINPNRIGKGPPALCGSLDRQDQKLSDQVRSGFESQWYSGASEHASL
jgi:hypothetical protein